MGVSIGTQLGSHEVIALLGKGGMGEVYRARDTKLKRDVAIKILPDEFASDANRVARFQREAEVLASLNHPNIALIYDFQQAGDTRFLVLELVEGETLAERIQRGPLPVEEALNIAAQICDALEVAHEKEIVHRDLKPANVKVTPDGKVKVLDFGLAKALESPPVPPNLSNSPTLSLAATNAGVILGTAAYMSPEQAKGAEADLRSDVFAFGCVLYELLSGRQAFQGESVSEILAAVLIRDADLSALPRNLNERLTDLLRRCLEKNPKRRWQAVGDLRAELEIISRAPRSLPTPAAVTIQPSSPWWKRAIPALLMTIFVSTLVGLAVWQLKPSSRSESVARFAVTLPDSQLFTRVGSKVIALSPDGTNLVYVAGRQLFLRKLGDLDARPIQGTQQDPGGPIFSPDGQWILFYSFADDAIKKIPITGGAAVTLCAACATTLGYGVSWEGSTIVFVRNRQEILSIPESGGKPEVWVKVNPDEAVSSPQLLPGGESMMFNIAKADATWDKADIVVFSRKSGQRKVLIPGGSSARYVPTGHIVYALGPNLYAIQFDLHSLTTTGGPVPVLENIMRSQLELAGAATNPTNFDFSKNGTLIYVPRSSTQVAEQRILAVADRSGKTSVLPGLGPGLYGRPRVSPDGRSVVLGMDDGSISIYDVSGKSQLRRLTFEGTSIGPIWSPDGRRIAYRSSRDGRFGIFLQAADGGGSVERLTTAASGILVQDYPFTWSPDGNNVVFTRDNRLWTISLIGDRKIEALSENNSYNATFSPDGKWLAYVSSDRVGTHVYIQEFPKGTRYQVSQEPSNAPLWTRDQKELLYYQNDSGKLVAVRIQTQPSFSVGEPAIVPIDRMIQPQGSPREYDTLPDGRLVVILPTPQNGETGPRPTQQINVVLNWYEELKQRVPVK